ncbi:MAG: hypothetical protein JJE35_13815 [Thermoleophilia bacterium]|nr:hypothetical protein [Thermoleophilia bacterium]
MIGAGDDHAADLRVAVGLAVDRLRRLAQRRGHRGIEDVAARGVGERNDGDPTLDLELDQ